MLYCYGISRVDNKNQAHKKGWKKVNSTHNFIVCRVSAFWNRSCFPSTDLIRVRQKIKFSMCTWGRTIWEALKNKMFINMNTSAIAKKTNKEIPNEIWTIRRHRNILHSQYSPG